MCGRFTLRTPTETIADLFSGIEFPDIPPSYNVAPTQSIAVLRDSGDGPQFAWLRWGLVPFWADDIKLGNRMLNARSETVDEKPSFRAAFKKRRCLILADGFYEWKKTPDGKQPTYIHRQDDQVFTMAGLWERNRKVTTADGHPVETCTIITTTANSLMAPIHDRMPVILDANQRESWLAPDNDDVAQLKTWLVPCDATGWETYPVSTEVNKPAFNTPACIEEIN